eukprot:Lankesteria_metandrocarpae@DN4546_c0_g1_i2.p1
MRHYIVNCLLLGIISLNTFQVGKADDSKFKIGKNATVQLLASMAGDAKPDSSSQDSLWNVAESGKIAYKEEFLKAIADDLKVHGMKELKPYLRKSPLIYIDASGAWKIVRLTTSGRWPWKSSPIKIRHPKSKWRLPVAYGKADVGFVAEIAPSILSAEHHNIWLADKYGMVWEMKLNKLTRVGDNQYKLYKLWSDSPAVKLEKFGPYQHLVLKNGRYQIFMSDKEKIHYECEENEIREQLSELTEGYLVTHKCVVKFTAEEIAKLQNDGDALKGLINTNSCPNYSHQGHTTAGLSLVRGKGGEICDSILLGKSDPGASGDTLLYTKSGVTAELPKIYDYYGKSDPGASGDTLLCTESGVMVEFPKIYDYYVMGAKSRHVATKKLGSARRFLKGDGCFVYDPPVDA